MGIYRFPVPQNNRRACLCRDGSYSTKCCDPDDYFSQGIGPTQKSKFILYTEGGDKIVQENGFKLFQ